MRVPIYCTCNILVNTTLKGAYSVRVREYYVYVRMLYEYYEYTYTVLYILVGYFQK